MKRINVESSLHHEAKENEWLEKSNTKLLQQTAADKAKELNCYKDIKRRLLEKDIIQRKSGAHKKTKRKNKNCSYR